jgi:dihydroorotase
MEEMSEAKAAGFTDDGIPIMDEKLLKEAMERAKVLDQPISLHEEDPNFLDSPGVNKGKISKELGVGGASAMAEDVLVARDCMIAYHTGAKVNIQHISSKNSVEIVRMAKKLGANVYAEATPHHFTLTEDAVLEFGTLARMNPPLRTKEDRQAIIEGLKDGTIDFIATDHAPHSVEEKAKAFKDAPSGITGLETSLALGVTTLVRNGHLTMMQLMEKMSKNPATLYRLESRGITKGAPADLVIFDPNAEFVVGDYESKAVNSPFTGSKLYGVVNYTICDGKIVYQRK